jgi:hypothetical protein
MSLINQLISINITSVCDSCERGDEHYGSGAPWVVGWLVSWFISKDLHIGSLSFVAKYYFVLPFRKAKFCGEPSRAIVAMVKWLQKTAVSLSCQRRGDASRLDTRTVTTVSACMVSSVARNITII